MLCCVGCEGLLAARGSVSARNGVFGAANAALALCALRAAPHRCTAAIALRLLTHSPSPIIQHRQADKGIRCPFCRTYIDGYRSLRG